MVERLNSWVDQNSSACASVLETLRSNVVLSGSELLKSAVYFFICFCTKMDRDINEMSDETEEFNDCKRQLQRRKLRRARVACETEDQHERRLQLRRHREQSRWAREASLKTQKRLKAERQRDVSRRQCETAEQRSHRLQVQNEGNSDVRRKPPNGELKDFNFKRLPIVGVAKTKRMNTELTFFFRLK